MPLGLIVALTRVMTVFGQSVSVNLFCGISLGFEIQFAYLVSGGRGRPFIVQSEVN